VVKAHKKRPVSAVRRLHRSLGAGAALFVIFLVLSGLAINHSHSLGLDKKPVSQDLLLDWYGLEKPETVTGYKVAGRWISFAGSQVFLDEEAVSNLANGVGAVAAGDLLLVAGSEELLLLDGSGQLIERQAWQTAPADPVTAVGVLPDGTVSLKTTRQTWLADADFIQWTSVEDQAVTPVWAQPGPLPGNLMQAVTRSYRGHGLNLERVLLDLHSGRFFGTVGVLVYDLLALVLGFLAVSGLVLWFRGPRNGKKQGSRAKRQ
jgi:hypothetical protein